MMEANETEMSKEELQRWIRDEVKKRLISPGVLEKINLMQSLLERKVKLAADLLKLCQSVAAFEELVKKQYSLLEWEYKDTHSDDDDNPTTCGHTQPLPCESETQVHSLPTSNSLCPLVPKLIDNKNLERDNRKKHPFILKRGPVVVLTRLPASKIARALPPPAPQKPCSNDDSSSSAESDAWEPEDDSHDSDYFISHCNTRSKKRRKMNQKTRERKRCAALQASRNSDAETDVNTSTPTAGTNSAKSNGTETSTLQAPPASLQGATPVCTASAQGQSFAEAVKPPIPGVPLGEVGVNMNILARRKAMDWQPGKITKIKTKGGKLKYKVSFEEKGKILVSGHHIAFECMPKLDQLFVGARVVVKYQGDELHFLPGVLAEVPSRKNRMRFLVIADDDRPIYVGLTFLHLVCRPLADPLDDIPDGSHKNFLREYMNSWPYPPMSQYKVGQTLNAEFNGFQQRCEVLVVDSSLIQVVFLVDQHQEWIHRGSVRLERTRNMLKSMKLKRKDQRGINTPK